MTVSQEANWFEIALYEHWSSQPHGIARATQRLFIEAVKAGNCRFIYYHPRLEKFIEPEDLAYFIDLSGGLCSYVEDALPHGRPLGPPIGGLNTVLLTGAGWEYRGFIAEVSRLRKIDGMQIACITYDLIAIHSPHFFEQSFAEKVRNCLFSLLDLCDHFLCISQSTCDDVYKLTQGKKRTSTFRLGSNIERENVVRVSTTESQGAPFVLCVGTVEVRKNHLLLYYVWRKLVLRFGGQCPRLVIVGRVGWLTADAIELITRDPLVKEFIEVRSAVDDAEMAALYRECLFTVYPSFYEGYGLPVAESLAYGRVCVCSNSSSLPEINPIAELMFDPYDAANATGLIESLLSDSRLIRSYENRIRTNYQSASWEQAFDDLSRFTYGSGTFQ